MTLVFSFLQFSKRLFYAKILCIVSLTLTRMLMDIESLFEESWLFWPAKRAGCQQERFDRPVNDHHSV
jgi:hypothetical protein